MVHYSNMSVKPGFTTIGLVGDYQKGAYVAQKCNSIHTIQCATSSTRVINQQHLHFTYGSIYHLCLWFEPADRNWTVLKPQTWTTQFIFASITF